MKEEFIDVVDENGTVISSATKKRIYKDKLCHQIVHVLIYDKFDRMICQVRSMAKEYCPGYISTSVGGHISSGELPEDAAKREMAEEIGKTGELEHLFSDWYEGEEKIRKILHVYKSGVRPPFTLNQEEVERMEHLSCDELKQLPDNKIHPELKFIINYLDNEKN
jgi:isopentenyldiphosphate isomerase